MFFVGVLVCEIQVDTGEATWSLRLVAAGTGDASCDVVLPAPVLAGICSPAVPPSPSLL